MLERRVRKRNLEALEQRIAPSLTPIGPEFRVNQYTYDHQRFGKVGVDGEGNYVVAYHGFLGVLQGFWVTAQRYQADGTPVGEPIHVGPAYSIGKVHVAVNNQGDFIVVWDVPGPVDNPEGRSQVYARRYNALGQPLGNSFQAHAATGVDFVSPTAVLRDDGNFAIAWSRFDTLIPPVGRLQARWFDSNGSPMSGDVTIQDNIRADEDAAWVAQDSGHFVIAWHDYTGNKFRRYDSQGQPVSEPISVEPGNVFQSPPDIADMPDDGFVVVWGSNSSIKLRRFSAFGSPIGDPVPVVNQGYLSFPNVSSSDAGELLVSWSVAQENNYVQQFDSALVATSAVIRINTLPFSDTGFKAVWPKAAVDADGDAMIVYWSWNQDGNGWGTYARLFAGSTPEVEQSSTNGGSLQRSNVTNLGIEFNRTLVLPANPEDAFEVTGPSGLVPFDLDLSSSTSAGTVVEVVFPNGVPNGQYNLKVKASMLHDTAGQSMGADYDMPFHRLLGDFNGDAKVDHVDFASFRSAFSGTAALFDFNNDGIVNAVDFSYFRAVYGLRI